MSIYVFVAYLYNVVFSVLFALKGVIVYAK